MKRVGILMEGRTRMRDLTGFQLRKLVCVLALTLRLLFFGTAAHAQAGPSEPQGQSLGSLNTAGEVYLNESRAPSELTIFSGDILRTGETGTAVLTTTGKGSFEISHQSQVGFDGDPRYFAELKQGTISLKTSGGEGPAAVRAGNFVVVQTNRNEQTAATIASLADGSFLVTCSAGNVGVIPLQQTTGLFLQAGQSARISPNGELTASNPATPAAPAPPVRSGSNRRLWIYLGLAGAGAGAGIAVALANGASHPPVSPSSP
jgi:hypothetical protein